MSDFDKYLKYKTKYLNLKKLLGGNNCDIKFQEMMDVKMKDTAHKIYHGPINIVNDVPIEEECGLEDLYAKSKSYIDSLNRFKQFILWNYTAGSLARLINNYLLVDKKIDKFYELNMSRFAIFFEIKWFYFFEIDGVQNAEVDRLKQILEQIIIGIWDNFSKINKAINDDDKKSTPENKMNTNDRKQLQELLTTINNAPKTITNDKKINLLKLLFIKYDYNYPLVFAIYMIINNLDKDILSKFVEINLAVLTDILSNVPVIDRCIKLYKIIGKNTELYEIGKTYKQKVINSLTCSRKSNISIFYDRKENKCCLLEITCKPGTKILFLNYLNTAYGSKMLEVLLPAGYDFKIITSSDKDILTHKFEEVKLKPKNKDFQPIFDIKYKDPEIKKIKVYEVELL